MRIMGARGFTLVEMLLVIAVIIILTGLIVPAITPLLRGTQITQGGDLVTSQLEVARQTALARNRSVQVRICRPNNGQYTSIMPLIASFATNQNGTLQTNSDGTPKITYTLLGKPVSLPNGVLIDSGTKLSTILNPAGVTATSAPTTDPQLGNQGTNYQYIAFQFRPDGSTDLGTAGSPWFLTVHNATDGDGLQNPPSNYCTIQVDPYNGHLQQFRP